MRFLDLTLLVAAWGVAGWLSLPPPYGPATEALRGVFPLWAWAALLALVGVGHLVAFTPWGQARREAQASVAALALGAWWAICGVVASQYPATVVVPLTFALGLGACSAIIFALNGRTRGNGQMGPVWQRLREIVNTHDTEPTELFLAIAMLLRAGWYLHPIPVFALPHYRTMAEIAPEWAWGGVFLVFGLAGLVGVLAQEPLLRRFSLFWGAVSWFIVGVNFLLIEPRIPTIGLLLALSVASAWAWVRLKRV